MSDGGRKKSTVTAESEQVEQLLLAAQDEVLLQLSVGSHMSRVAPDYLHPDLDRRFQALRSQPSAIQSTKQKQKRDESQRQQGVAVDHADKELSAVLGEDLSARFAALKASLSSSSSSSATVTPTKNEVRLDQHGSGGQTDVAIDSHLEDDGSEDEVEKVIRWATDAARLDPSCPSDNEEDSDDYDDDDLKSKKGHKK